MEDDCSGGRSQQTLAQHRNSNGNGKRKIGLYDRPESGFKGRYGEKADEEDCDVEVWSSLSNSFNQVQSVLDQNNVLIRQVNENQQSKIPDNLAKNVALIREINTNISKVHHLLKLYKGIEVPTERLLFKILSTWQVIEACRVLESEGIQTHLTFVYNFPQAAAAAQAGASVIQVFVGQIRDWARNHYGDPEVEATLGKGEDPVLALG